MTYLDTDMISELRMILEEDLDEIVAEFTETLEQRIDQLYQSYHAGEHAQIAELAHSIKGSAGNLGASAIAERTAEIEQLAKAQSYTDIAPLLEELPTMGQETLAAFRAQGF